MLAHIYIVDDETGRHLDYKNLSEDDKKYIKQEFADMLEEAGE